MCGLSLLRAHTHTQTHTQSINISQGALYFSIEYYIFILIITKYNHFIMFSVNVRKLVVKRKTQDRILKVIVTDMSVQKNVIITLTGTTLHGR